MSKYIDFNKIIRIDDGYNNNNTRKKKEGRRAGVEGGLGEEEGREGEREVGGQMFINTPFYMVEMVEMYRIGRNLYIRFV